MKNAFDFSRISSTSSWSLPPLAGILFVTVNSDASVEELSDNGVGDVNEVKSPVEALDVIPPPFL